MNEAPTTLTTRRHFLSSTLLGGAVSATVPSFLASTFDTLHAATLAQTNPRTGRDAPILVVIQLAGGNDGLNTIVPHTNDEYFKARKRLARDKSTLIKLNDELAVPDVFSDFKEMYDAGHVGIVNGVGYPNPNRSHFRSTEIWHTASDADRFEREGWIGKYFDNCCGGEDPTVGVAVGKQSPQAFTSAKPSGVSLINPAKYGFQARGRGDAARNQDEAYRELSEDFDGDPINHNMSGDNINELGGGGTISGNPLEFLERTAMDARVSSDRINEIARNGRNEIEYPSRGAFADSLKLIARLIGGGLPTRIYYASQGGYDTHSNQMGTHNRLLREFASTMRAFISDLKKQGLLERVVVLTFSEFGRRVAENASGGTDHGAAAPLFLFGNKIDPGITGAYPSLAPQDLNRGDLKFHTDFRSVYASLLQNWMGASPRDTSAILGRDFKPMPLRVG